MGQHIEIEPVASAARTANGNSGTIELPGDVDSLRAQLDVTAASGTSPTLDVLVEDSLDGTNWNAVITFVQKTAAGREVLNRTDPIARRIRVKWTIAGALDPSFTFSVKLVAEED